MNSSLRGNLLSASLRNFKNPQKTMNGINLSNAVHQGSGERGPQPGEFLKKAYEAVSEANLFPHLERPEKVVNFLQPAEFEKVLDLNFDENGVQDMAKYEEIVQKIIKYSVKTTHKEYYNQLYQAMDEVGLAGAWLLEALNTNVHTYESAPLFVYLEYHTIQELVKLFGWSEGDGIFSPGGSLSNMYGILLARHKRYPNLKQEGLHSIKKPLVILTSDMSHYSMEKGASWMGFGSNQVISVKSDKYGLMRGPDLKAAIEKVRSEGKEPFFVNATAGSTVFGSFDPFDELADVCQEEGLWLHVDACWGGGVIFSSSKKELLKGIERVDSFAWNPHKMIGAPLQCSPFVVKHKGLLSECNRIGASYLFQPDKCYDVSFDTGDKSVQCGRKGDALKLWLMLKVRGFDYYGKAVDHAFDVARYFENKIRDRPGFRMVLDKHQCTNICFWYIPPSMRDQEENDEWKKKLHMVAPTIKTRLFKEGNLLVGYQPMASKDHVNFFRIVLTCFPRRTESDLDLFIEYIEKHGKDL